MDIKNNLNIDGNLIVRGSNAFITSAGNALVQSLSAAAIYDTDFTGSKVLISSPNKSIGESVTTSTELNYVSGVTASIQTQLNSKEGTLAFGTTAQYYRGDKTWQTLNTSIVPELTNLYYTDARVKTYADTLYLPITGIDASKITSGTIDPARIPVLPSQVPQVTTNIPSLTLAQQNTITSGTIVTTSDDGFRYVYSGTGSKTTSASYVVLADITPEWSAVSNRPTNVSYWTNDSGYLTTTTGDARYSLTTHNHNGLYLTSTSALNPANVTQTSVYRFVTDSEKTTWNNKQNGSSVLTSVAALSTGTGLLKLTNGTASLDTNTYATTTQLGSYLQLAGGWMDSGASIILQSPINGYRITLDPGDGTAHENCVIYVGRTNTTGPLTRIFPNDIYVNGTYNTNGYKVWHAGNLTGNQTGHFHSQYALSTSLSAYLPLSGGTLTGHLYGASAQFTYGTFVDMVPGTAYAIKASGGIAVSGEVYADRLRAKNAGASTSGIILNTPTAQWGGICISGSGTQTTMTFSQVDASGALIRKSDISAKSLVLDGTITTGNGSVFNGDINVASCAYIGYGRINATWSGSGSERFIVNGNGRFTDYLAVNGRMYANDAEIGGVVFGIAAINSWNTVAGKIDNFVQGNGNGLYGRRSTNISSFDTLLKSGFYDTNAAGPFGTVWQHLIRSTHTDPSNGQEKWSFDIAAAFANGNGSEGYKVRVNTSAGWGAWRTIWTDLNLNQNCSTNQAPTFAGLTVSGQINATDTVNGILFGGNGRIWRSTGLYINDPSAISIRIAGTERLGISSTTLALNTTHLAGSTTNMVTSVTSPVFYSSSTTANSVQYVLGNRVGSTETNGLELGPSDGANYSVYNMAIRCHYGLALKSYDGVVRTIFNTRTGHIDTLGNIRSVNLTTTTKVTTPTIEFNNSFSNHSNITTASYVLATTSPIYLKTTITTTRIDIDNAGYDYSWTKYIRQGGSANIYPSTTPGLNTYYNGILKTANFTWSGCLQIVHIDNAIYCSDC